MTIMTGLAHDHDDLFGTWRVGRILHPLVVRRPAGEIPRGRRRRTPTPRRIHQDHRTCRHDHSFIEDWRPGRSETHPTQSSAEEIGASSRCGRSAAGSGLNLSEEKPFRPVSTPARRPIVRESRSAWGAGLTPAWRRLEPLGSGARSRFAQGGVLGADGPGLPRGAYRPGRVSRLRRTWRRPVPRPAPAGRRRPRRDHRAG